AAPADRADDRAQHVDRVGVAPALVVVGEERAYVGSPAAGAEHRVDHRVGEDVGVRVAGEAARVVDLDPAQHQAPSLLEAVAVVADPYGHGSILRCLRSKTAISSIPSPARNSVARS